MAAGPRAVVEVAAKPLEPRFDVAGRHLRKGRDRAAHARVQVGVRPPPVGAEEAVRRSRAGIGSGYTSICPSARLSSSMAGQICRSIDGELGEVVVDQPEAEIHRIPRDHDDAAPGDAPKLGRARARGRASGARSGRPALPSKPSSRNGSAVAEAWTTGALPALRWRIIVIAGSTATTRSVARARTEPAPAPTFTTVSVSPSARVIAAAMRGSGRRRAR